MIISASRRTDIPAYYTDWFIDRIKEQFVLVKNPFNVHQISEISLSPDAVDCIVFWTKNPRPMLDKLDALKDYHYYFQFTLNSYGKDVEVNIPSKSKNIIDSFKRLSERLGAERVIWRYDPIFLNSKYTMEYHAEYYGEIAFRLKDYTKKCTISFMDHYPKIKRNIAPLAITEMSIADKRRIAEQIYKTANEFGLEVDTCAEDIELDDLGITHAACIDARLVSKITGRPFTVEKDKNQRPRCGCAVSKDIGMYNTCKNGCKYCYANHSDSAVLKNAAAYEKNSPLLCDKQTEADFVKGRKL